MKLKHSIFTFLLIVMLVCSTAFAGDFVKGQTYHGFKLLEKRFVKEVNAECFYFEHEKSGAHLFKIAADDPNKTFSIAFKTDPESNCGTPHIMEHSVLNGSKNYPAKSPIDILGKGSLLSFINAFTGNDFTCYPIAGMNEKDYFNVTRVYLDAVFNPLIYTEPRILKQEGWHYEMEKPDGPIVYKGVVYNEMKGSFSNPTRELDYQRNKNLFPDISYRFSSGGYPTEIPRLTPEMFMKYHQKYYHPVNSYILLYGNADLDRELAAIDSEYLSKYDKAVRPSGFALQKPFTAMKVVTSFYPVTEGSNTDKQTYLSLSFVCGLGADRATVMSLNILSDLLVNQEAAPIRLALQKAGIGQNVIAGVDDLQQNIFEIMVQNANPTDKDKFRKIVMATLEEVSQKGLDKKAVEGAINRTEFQLREGNSAQKGIRYNFQVLPGWLYADDPFLTLEYEKPLAVIKTAITGNYLESIIRKHLIANPHSLLLVMEPKPGMEKEINAGIEKELQAYKASLSEKEKETIVKETQDLIAYQKREDTPEALATVPMLSRNDIDPKVAWYTVEEQHISSAPVLYHDEFTNHVLYTRMLFDARVLPTELIPYAALLAKVLGSQNTENYSFGDLDVALNIHTGGVNAFLSTYQENRDDDNLIPKFVIEAKVMNKKVDKLFQLLDEIVNKTRYADIDRLQTILIQYQSNLDAAVKRNGFVYSRTRLASYFSNTGMFDEMTTGFEYYWFINNLVKNFAEKKNEISENLARAASLLFNKSNLIAAVTCSRDDLPAYSQELPKFVNSLPEGKTPVFNKWKFNLEKKNEGFLTASKVQFVQKGYNLKKLGYTWSGKIRVLSQILSSDWLQNRVRIIGGAYGGFCSFSSNGQVIFSSYRDPNLKETLDNYDAIPDYLDKLDLNDKDLTRYIIGTISTMDNPLTPSEKGTTALRYYFEKTKPEDIQRERDEVLSVSLGDIKAMKKMAADILGQNDICVYGSEEKINSHKELFGKIEKVDK
jgi:presequence protease